MFTRHHHRVKRRGSSALRKKSGRGERVLSRRQFWVERLEERYMLSVNALIGSLPPLLAPGPSQSHVDTSSSSVPAASLAQTAAGTGSLQPWVLQGPAPSFNGQIDIGPNNPVSG